MKTIKKILNELFSILIGISIIGGVILFLYITQKIGILTIILGVVTIIVVSFLLWILGDMVRSNFK